MKKIIVACGAGIATSGAVAAKLNNMLAEHGLSGRAKVEPVDIKSLDNYMSTSDLYVSITPMRGAQKEYPIPVVNDIPFLVDNGEDPAFYNIVKTLGL